MSSSTGEKKVITTRNAAELTAYELRQELVRRGAFDLEDDAANFKSMLRRLMVELVKDENKETEQKTAEIERIANETRDEAKRVREERKREALERSKQRQTDPEYFNRITELNKKPEKEVVDTTDTANNGTEGEETGETVDENQSHSAAYDPFRPHASRNQKSKIFVR